MWTLENLRQQTRCEGEFVAFSRKAERLQLAQGQQAAKVVPPVQRSNPLDRPSAGVARRRALVGDLVRELVTQSPNATVIRLDKICGVETTTRSRWRVAGELERERLAGLRRSMSVDQLNGVGDAVLRVRDQRRGLLGLIGRMELSESGIGHLLNMAQLINSADGCATAIPDRCLFEHVAEGIHLERQRVLDAWVRRIALVVIRDRFARVGEKNGMAVLATGLHQPNIEVLLRDGVGRLRSLKLVSAGARYRVIRVDPLTQRRGLEGAAGFPFLIEAQSIGKDRVGY